MVAKFTVVLSLAFALFATNTPDQAFASSSVSPLPTKLEQQKTTGALKDKSPNRGNGRRENSVNRSRFTIQ